MHTRKVVSTRILNYYNFVKVYKWDFIHIVRISFNLIQSTYANLNIPAKLFPAKKPLVSVHFSKLTHTQPNLLSVKFPFISPMLIANKAKKSAIQTESLKLLPKTWRNRLYANFFVTSTLIISSALN